MMKLILSFFDRFRNIPANHRIFRGYYHDGDVVYTYLSNTDSEKHVFDGDFKVKYDFGEGKYAKAKGTYANDIKQGHWEFVRNGFTTKRSLSLDFNHGQMEGMLACTFEKKGFFNFQMSKLTLTVKDGTIVGPVMGVLENVDIPDDFKKDPKLVEQVNRILEECIPVLLELAPRGHDVQVPQVS
jgi:hypothetical protein